MRGGGGWGTRGRKLVKLWYLEKVLDINALLPTPQPPSLTQNSSWEYGRKLIYEFLLMRRLASITSHPYFPLHYSWAGESSHTTSLKNLLSVIIKFKAFYCKNLSWMCWRIVLHPSRNFIQTNWQKAIQNYKFSFFLISSTTNVKEN